MSKEKFYNELVSYYDFMCGDRKADVEILKKLIKKHKKSTGNNLLDVACGLGLEDKYLKKDFDVTGIDLNKGVIAIAKKRNPEIVYKIGDMKNFKINNKFDVITCFDAMCHLKNYNDLRTTLKNFSNHLISGGVLIFYMDDQFLKEHYKEDKILITQKSRGGLTVILLEIYQKITNGIENSIIYLIKKSGRVKIRILPQSLSGFFAVNKIRKILSDLGFKSYLYSMNPKTTFSTKKYSKESIFPIFICEKR